MISTFVYIIVNTKLNCKQVFRLQNYKINQFKLKFTYKLIIQYFTYHYID
jgi:hypothetical protein